MFGFAMAARAHSELDSDFSERVRHDGVVPLGWVRPTTNARFPNLGDALSPVIVAAISGLPITKCEFDAKAERLVSVGTIGHGQRNGRIHFWGTGMDAANYAPPPETEFVAHAMRGPYSEQVLQGVGVSVRQVYGDPVWFLPKLLPRGNLVTPNWDLGVVVHISELEAPTPEALTKAAFRRYEIPSSLSKSIRIINTFTQNSLVSLFDKVDDIVSCARIASTSFHGMVIADTYGIPCVWFGPRAGGASLADPRDADHKLDHRVADFYAGTAARRVPIYCQERDLPTDWETLLRWIDAAWSPIAYDAAPLFDAFPLDRVVSLSDTIWPLRARTFHSLLP